MVAGSSFFTNPLLLLFTLIMNCQRMKLCLFITFYLFGELSGDDSIDPLEFKVADTGELADRRNCCCC